MKVFLLIIVAMILVSCTEQADIPIVETEPEPEPLVNITEPVLVQPQMNSELKALIAKADKVKGMEYNLKSTEQVAFYKVSGAKTKISFSQRQKHNDYWYFDIYLDDEKQIAYLACAKDTDCDGKKTAMEASYNKYKTTETPLGIIEKLTVGEITERTQIDNRATAVVSYVWDNMPTKLWLWEYYGLPLRKQYVENGVTKTIDYANLVVRTVLESEVSLPAALEII
ncbi:MAG: hypothetical protein ABIG95_03310 [Candidatus Woesearchaeota archaeon]